VGGLAQEEGKYSSLKRKVNPRHIVEESKKNGRGGEKGEGPGHERKKQKRRGRPHWGKYCPSSPPIPGGKKSPGCLKKKKEPFSVKVKKRKVEMNKIRSLISKE